MGLIGGSLFQGIKGYRNAPIGLNKRLIGSLAAIKERGPITGGHFAVWGGLFSTFDCTLVHLRGKEDPWNSIMSGALTGATLAMRQGTASVITSGVIGAVFLGLIEGMSILMTQFSAQEFRPISPLDMPEHMGQQQGG